MKKGKRSLAGQCMMLIAMLVALALCGCGEEEEDYEHAKNPDDYVIENLQNVYGRNAEIISKTKMDKEDYIYEVCFKEEPEITFQACTYWYVADAIPTRSYEYMDNYKDRKNACVLTELLAGNEDYAFRMEEEDQQGITFYDFILEIQNEAGIAKLPSFLEKLGQNQNLNYDFMLKICYRDQNTVVTISDKSEYHKKEYYSDKLSELYAESTETQTIQ